MVTAKAPLRVTENPSVGETKSSGPRSCADAVSPTARVVVDVVVVGAKGGGAVVVVGGGVVPGRAARP